MFYPEYGRDSQNKATGIYFCRSCKVLHGRCSEKKKKDFITCLCRYIQKMQYFSECLPFQNLVSRFSQNVGLIMYFQEDSTMVLYRLRYFLLKRVSKIADAMRFYFLNDFYYYIEKQFYN